MVRQDRTAGKLGDDRRVDAGELGVIHKEPRFPGPPHRRGLDRCLFGVGVVNPASSATPLAPRKAFVKLYCCRL